MVHEPKILILLNTVNTCGQSDKMCLAFKGLTWRSLLWSCHAISLLYSAQKTSSKDLNSPSLHGPWQVSIDRQYLLADSFAGHILCRSLFDGWYFSSHSLAGHCLTVIFCHPSGKWVTDKIPSCKWGSSKIWCTEYYKNFSNEYFKFILGLLFSRKWVTWKWVTGKRAFGKCNIHKISLAKLEARKQWLANVGPAM